MTERTISFTVNGRGVRVSAPPMRRLLDVLREDLQLTGAKEGCGEGECGACSVIVDGELVNSCLVPVIQVEGARVTTIEAVHESPLGAAVQEAFLRHGGSQCGICTPGMVMTAWWLSMNRAKLPAGAGLRDLMAGNLCRCTGYDLIVRSVEAALAAGDVEAGAGAGSAGAGAEAPATGAAAAGEAP